MQTALTRRLGLAHPIIQAPMAGTSTPELAAAVSNAGALGSIAFGAIDPGTARRDLRQTRALTERPFNVNLFCYTPHPPDEMRNRDWVDRLRPLFAGFAWPAADRTRVSAVISGRPARGLENDFMRRADETAIAPYPYAYDIGKALNAAASAAGDDGYAPQWAGQAAPLARALPAADLVARLAEETREAVACLSERTRGFMVADRNPGG